VPGPVGSDDTHVMSHMGLSGSARAFGSDDTHVVSHMGPSGTVRTIRE